MATSWTKRSGVSSSWTVRTTQLIKNFLLINSSDFLLINSSDKLIISSSSPTWTERTKPSTSWTERTPI